jgi:hypothetical protein
MHYSYGGLFLQLYPATDWKNNLMKLSKEIDKKKAKDRNFKMKRVTAKEWWTFHALMLSSQQVISSGMAIFDKNVDSGLFPAPDFERFMQKHRFKSIKKQFALAFSEDIESKEQEQYEVNNGCKVG